MPEGGGRGSCEQPVAGNFSQPRSIDSIRVRIDANSTYSEEGEGGVGGRGVSRPRVSHAELSLFLRIVNRTPSGDTHSLHSPIRSSLINLSRC